MVSECPWYLVGILRGCYKTSYHQCLLVLGERGGGWLGVQHHDGGYMTLYICQNPQNVQHKSDSPVSYGLWLIIMNQY